MTININIFFILLLRLIPVKYIFLFKINYNIRSLRMMDFYYKVNSKIFVYSFSI